MNHASALMTSELIREAVDIARLSILELLRISDHAKPVFVYVVVLSPFERDDPNDPFGVLYERVIGEFFLDDADVNERKHRYRAIAHSKAVIARRMQMDTGLVAATCPAMFDGGDTYYEGGVCFAGIPVGTSGVESFFDEAISRIIATAINALIKSELKKRRENKDPFL